MFYLAAYTLMNLAAFAVITIRERETPFGDDIRSVEGLGSERPALALALTVSMLALAGLPGTAGFIGKLYLIEATVDADYTWLGVMIAIGTMISLAYYLRVLAYVWMRGASGPERPAGGDARDRRRLARGRCRVTGARCTVIIGLALLAAAATVFFGVIPSPLVDWANHAGAAIALAALSDGRAGRRRPHPRRRGPPARRQRRHAATLGPQRQARDNARRIGPPARLGRGDRAPAPGARAPPHRRHASRLATASRASSARSRSTA